MFEESKLLVIGGSGKLGSACKALMPRALYPPRSELDIQDAGSVDAFFQTHDVLEVLLLAAMASIPQCENDRSKTYDVNIEGVRRVLDAIKRKGGVRHLVYVSTACVFPGTDAEIMEDEDSIPYPKHFYGMTKWVAEEIVRSASFDGLKTTVVRTNFTSMPWEYPRAFTDRYGTYLFAHGVARGLKDVFLSPPERPVIHITGDRKMSMYEYAVAGGSDVEPLTLSEYTGPPLTVNMSLKTKYWKQYHLEDDDP